MNSSFLINDLLKNINKENINKELYKYGILSKIYDEDNLILLYNKFNESNSYSNLQRECRSLVIEKDTLKMISYSCETPYTLNNLNILTDSNKIINKCYEGTLLSLFYYNDKWYISTRRCLHSKDSILNKKSHYNMFEDVIINTEFNNINNFTNLLNKNYKYNFVLIHYENIHIIDYTNEFGNNYTKLCLISIYDNNFNELSLYDKPLDFICNNIFISSLLNDNEIKDYQNNLSDIINYEGLIIKLWNNNLNKYNLFKLQNINYQLKSLNNIYIGLIYLYQKNKLINYLGINKHLVKINNYDTIGIIDNIFRICSNELFELYNMFWSFNGTKLNNNLYKSLPNEYKIIFYNIKGLNKDRQITINNIYNYIKLININILVNYIKKKYNLLKDNNHQFLIKIDDYKKSLFIKYVELII